MKSIVSIFGVRFDNIRKKELCGIYKKMLDNSKGNYIVTPNANILEHARTDSGFKTILNDASLCIADGIGVVYASKLLRCPLKERIAGVEAGEMMLCLLCKRKNDSVFFLGGRNGVAEKAALRASFKYKGIDVSGTHHGYFNIQNEENDAVLKQINDSKATVLLVCMGSPRQEKWIADNIGKLENIKVALALGGAIDVYSGEVKRAPEVFRENGLEWLWRVFAVEGHFKRVVGISSFAFYAFAQAVKKKKRDSTAKKHMIL